MQDSLADGWAADELEHVSVCPACGSPRRSSRFSGLRDTVFATAPGCWSAYGCDQCGSVYLDPRPDRASIGKAYGSYYTHESVPRPDPQKLSPLKRLARQLANGYRNARYGTDFQPSARAGRWLRLLPAARYAIESAYRSLDAGHGRRLLDVGCGSGSFLANASSIGWNATGVEPDASAVEAARARGLAVEHGTLEVMSGQPQHFDLITLHHVIEHLHDPLATLTQCRSLLRPGGELIVETPNVESFGLQWFGAHWRGLECPRHLTLYSETALRQLLELAGFGQVKKLPARPVQRRIFSQSVASRAGLIPSAGRRPAQAAQRLLVSALALSARVMVLFRSNRAEFITLRARL